MRSHVALKLNTWTLKVSKDFVALSAQRTNRLAPSSRGLDAYKYSASYSAVERFSTLSSLDLTAWHDPGLHSSVDTLCLRLPSLRELLGWHPNDLPNMVCPGHRHLVLPCSRMPVDVKEVKK